MRAMNNLFLPLRKDAPQRAGSKPRKPDSRPSCSVAPPPPPSSNETQSSESSLVKPPSVSDAAGDLVDRVDVKEDFEDTLQDHAEVLLDVDVEGGLVETADRKMDDLNVIPKRGGTKVAAVDGSRTKCDRIISIFEEYYGRGRVEIIDAERREPNYYVFFLEIDLI